MKKIWKCLIGLIIFIVLVFLYARYIGTYGFITKEYTLYSEDIPTSYDGLKVVHFSDIHYNRIISLDKINKIVDEINLINPDIVVFTGDLVDKDVSLVTTDYVELTEAFSKIKAKYGKYAILGNHDYPVKDKVIQLFNDSDFNYLDNSYDVIYNQNSEKIYIAGVGNTSYNEDNLEKTMEFLGDSSEGSYKIILVHEPDISDNIVDNYDVSLILGGHSHNGQVRLPVIGALYTPDGSKTYYDESYELNDTLLYISSGVGVSTMNFRLFNKPSINFYRINKTEEQIGE